MKQYNPEDRSADALYTARKPTSSINTLDPKLNLSISDEDILRGVASIRGEKNYHIVKQIIYLQSKRFSFFF